MAVILTILFITSAAALIGYVAWSLSKTNKHD